MAETAIFAVDLPTNDPKTAARRIRSLGRAVRTWCPTAVLPLAVHLPGVQTAMAMQPLFRYRTQYDIVRDEMRLRLDVKVQR